LTRVANGYMTANTVIKTITRSPSFAQS